MTKTSKQSGTTSKRRPQASDKTALSEAQLEAASGGQGCASGSHYPGGTLVARP
jgi:hypothetical protein